MMASPGSPVERWWNGVSGQVARRPVHVALYARDGEVWDPPNSSAIEPTPH
jgi:hypothetical protein